MENTSVLVLNASYEPLTIISWKDAFDLWFREKVEIVKEYSDIIVRTVSKAFKCPAVVRHLSYQKFERSGKSIRFNRLNVYARDNFRCQYCIDPGHKILTKDLNWIAAGELGAGNKIIGFDEYPESKGGRKYRESEILDFVFDVDDLYRVILDDGTEFKVTKDHLWLSKTSKKCSYQWSTTENLVGKLIPRIFKTWDSDKSFDAGWLAGIYDGEGWIRSRSAVVGVAQNDGIVLEKIKKILNEKNFEYNISQINKGKDCSRLLIGGGIPESIRLLGSIRPIRLIEKLQVEKMGRLKFISLHKILAVEKLKRGEIAKIKTSTSTFIADGFPHHNCGTMPGIRNLTKDHVVPRSQSGPTIWENIITSCISCNRKKADRTPEEAGMKLLSKPRKPDFLGYHRFQLRKNKAPKEWRDYLKGFI